jgi:hypothetical protein
LFIRLSAMKNAIILSINWANGMLIII